MISRIRGILTGIKDDRAFIEVAGITYGVLISPYLSEQLTTGGKIGTEITIHTLFYIEGSAGMGNLIPRIVGFLEEKELEFFKLLTTVQGFGVRKALRSLIIPVHDMAMSVETGNIAALKSLPEIGPKTAQKIIVELKGKTMHFLTEGNITETMPQKRVLTEEYQQDALDILIQMQYSQDEAELLLAKVIKLHPEYTNPEDIIQGVFRLQSK